MARQTFTHGQTVYVKRYGSSWHKAEVVEPEITRRAYGFASGRPVYYVGVRYIEGDKWATDRTHEIINNRQHITDEATYQEQERNRRAARDAQERATFERQKAALDQYRGYALRIVEVLGVSYPPGQVENLAQALFVDFEPCGEWARRERRAVVAKITGDAQTEPPRILPDRES